MIPTTDFPDIRNKTLIHSHNGPCMIIPREGDLVRLYLQLSDDDAKEVLDGKGRVDMTKWGPRRLLDVGLTRSSSEFLTFIDSQIAKRIFQPYSLSFPENLDWWTLYRSEPFTGYILRMTANFLFATTAIIQSASALHQNSRSRIGFLSQATHAIPIHQRQVRA